MKFSPSTPSFSDKQLPGHPFIAYENSYLCMDQVDLASVAAAHGTPLFVYSEAAILAALNSYKQALSGRISQICYAVKANPSLGLLQIFVKAGCGFDIVSGGELQRVLAAGGSSESIIFSGVGKSRDEIRQALQARIGCFNVESESELRLLSDVAVSMNQKAPISIRVNPNVDAKTHPYISTGLKFNKFGVAHDDTVRLYMLASKLPGLQVIGIDCHIGSQILDINPYIDAMDRVLDMVEAVESVGVSISHIDFGGGMGIEYHAKNADCTPQEQTIPSALILWSQLFKRIDSRGHSNKKIMIEPGRSLVGNAGVCLSEVLVIKPGVQKNFCIIDAAMNDLPRPALYQAFHEIVPVRELTDSAVNAMVLCDVVGPICESGDWIGRDRRLAIAEGEVLAVLSAGAYCMSMASNYNTRGRAAELLITKTGTHLIRQRESAADTFALEKLID